MSALLIRRALMMSKPPVTGWAFVAAGAVTSPSTSITVSLPTGWAVGDLLIILVTGRNPATPIPPTGWTTAFTATSNVPYTYVFWKIAASGDGPVAFTSAGNILGVSIAYSGITGHDVNDALTNVSPNTSVSTASMTTTHANDLVVSFYTGYAAGNFTAPASTTTRVAHNSAATPDRSILIVDELQVTAGGTTSRTATYSSSTALCAMASAFYP